MFHVKHFNTKYCVHERETFKILTILQRETLILYRNSEVIYTIYWGKKINGHKFIFPVEYRNKKCYNHLMNDERYLC